MSTVRQFFSTLGLAVLVASAGAHDSHSHGLADDTVPQTAGDSPKSKVSIVVKDGYRVFTSNGIPEHATGRFPNSHNPNAIGEQAYSYKMLVSPTVNAAATPAGHMIFGIALNGVPFDPATAEFWKGNMRSEWNYDALSGKLNLGLDNNNAHVQPGGAYHYHGIPTGLVKDQTKNARAMILVGYAADGFPIYSQWGYKNAMNPNSGLVEMTSSYRLKKGTRPGGTAGPGGAYDGTYSADWEYVKGAGTLDECNGRFGATPDYPAGVYHYYITSTFPFISRYFRGSPDASFYMKGTPVAAAGAQGGAHQETTRSGGGQPGGGGQSGPGGGPSGPPPSPGGGKGGGRPPPRR